MLDTLTSKPRQIQEKLSSSARQVWLASLGVVGSIEEGTSKTFDRLVSRGKKFGDRRQHDLEETKEEIESSLERLSSTVDQRVSNSLERIGVPSRSQIRLLSQKVERLTDLVADLQVPATPPVKAAAPKAAAAKTAAPKAAAPKTATAEAETPEADGPRTVYHVSPHEDGWKVMAEGAERATRVLATKAEALDTARELAKNQEPSQLVVHRVDGTIQAHYSYGETESEESAS